MIAIERSFGTLIDGGGRRLVTSAWVLLGEESSA